MNNIIAALIATATLITFGFIASLIRDSIIKYTTAVFSIMIILIGFLSSLNP